MGNFLFYHFVGGIFTNYTFCCFFQLKLKRDIRDRSKGSMGESRSLLEWWHKCKGFFLPKDTFMYCVIASVL